MRRSRLVVFVAVLALTTAAATPAFAQRRGSAAGGGRPSVGRAVPRGTFRPAPGRGRIAPVRPYRSWGNRSGLGYNLYYGYPFGFYGSGLYGGLYGGFFGPGWYGGLYSGYPLRYPGYWGYGYAAPYWGGGYAYGDAYPSAGSAAAVRLDGGVRLALAERDAEVYVDGYYAGTVDDFDDLGQRLTLEQGPHRIELRRDGFEPVSFEVNVEPGRTITYRTQLRPLAPQ